VVLYRVRRDQKWLAESTKIAQSLMIRVIAKLTDADADQLDRALRGWLGL
jgi:hypothetical protein